MSRQNLTFEQLEVVYAEIAAGVDSAGPEKSQLFLAKLALLLARDVGDPAAVKAAIENAAKHLD